MRRDPSRCGNDEEASMAKSVIPKSLLTDLEALPKKIVKRWQQSSQGVRKFKPAPTAWSLREIVWHLADVEMGYGWRFRMIVSEDEAPIVPFNQDLFAERLRYAELKPRAALDVYRALRHAILEIAKGLAPEQLSRVAIHPERGPITPLWILERLVAHDRAHLAQLDQRAAQYRAAKRAKQSSRGERKAPPSPPGKSRVKSRAARPPVASPEVAAIVITATPLSANLHPPATKPAGA
jgi:hypothetical protein